MRHFSYFMAILCLAGAVQAQPKDLISKDTQKAIDASLSWLAKQQHADGSFGTGQFEGNLGITSLAGLAFLSRGSEPANKEFDQAIEKAARFVLSLEDKQRPGFLNNPRASAHGPMYGHGYAVLFLADAHERIDDKDLRTAISTTLERSVKLLIDSQNADGGWRYQPTSKDADISVTSVQVVALRAARDVGIGVPRKTLDKAIDYVKSCQDPNNGGFRYQQIGFGGGSGFARSAAGLTALNRAGVGSGEIIDNGMKYLKNVHLTGGQPEMLMHYDYGHYYAAKAMWYAGDKQWQKWYPTIRDELLQTRKDDRWAKGLSCPHYQTSVALIILQMPHNQLASMKR